MVTSERIEDYRKTGRYIEIPKPGDDDLGPLKLLPGVWKNTGAFEGRGWNMTALPFFGAPPKLDYRLLLNQFNEELKFDLVDKAIPNRGVAFAAKTNTDQFVVALDFEQKISQKIAVDKPVSGLAGAPDLAIHREPGLWMFLTNEVSDGLDIARLSTIPHGDSLLAMGKSITINGAPTIPAVNGLPIGVAQVLASPYLEPYRDFNNVPFKGTIAAAGFPGFNPVQPHLLLQLGMPQNVVRTTVLKVDTKVQTGGIHNIPFVVKQANAADMESTFWIMELAEQGPDGNPKLVLAYLQVVMLEFFPRADGQPGLIRWPHVSINMMEKSIESSLAKAAMPAV